MTEQSGLEVTSVDQFVSALVEMQRQGNNAQAEFKALPAAVRYDMGAGDFVAISKATADFMGTIPGIHMSPKIRTTMADVRHIIASDKAIAATMTEGKQGRTEVSVTFPDKDNPFGTFKEEASVKLSRVGQGKLMSVDLTFKETGKFIGGSISLGTQEHESNIFRGEAKFDERGIITSVASSMGHLIDEGTTLSIPSIISSITSPASINKAPDVEGIIIKATR